MGIVIQEQTGLFTLVTDNTMYQMKADALGVLLHTYYGRRTAVCDFSYLISYQVRGFSGNPYEAGTDRTYSLDFLPLEYPAYGSGDYRSCAFKVQYANGTSACDLRYAGYEIQEGKYAIHGLPAMYAEADTKADTLVIYLEDTIHSLRVKLLYGVLENLDVITRAVEVENIAHQPACLQQVMSACMDSLRGGWELMSFYGRHAGERFTQRTPLYHGVQSVGSTRGASSHQYNPFLILCEKETGEEQGGCYGFSLAYSGDFLGQVDYSQYDETRLLLGISPENFSCLLEPGQVFRTPEVIMAYSGEGLGHLSRLYHRAIRHNLCRGKYKTLRRPVVLNSWEGVYFDFTGEKLLAMAEEAAGLGIELFVVDDGWFGHRNNNRSSLGDWTANEQKLGCTMGQLSEKIHSLGMEFGLWFEPECVSEDSDLYRVHPDWALQIPGKNPGRTRNQLVLDMSREDVREEIFRQMCEVLDHAKVEYLKWDFNRSLSDLYSAALPAQRQGEVAYRYVLGLYDLLERLLARYPDMMIEGCSGGGGRFDAGMLYYTPQIWCSDNTDAIERLTIQYGTSFGYPVSTVGAHVSKSPNEVTGRETSAKTRAVVAMAGSFGYELDVTWLSEAEKEEIRQQIRDFKTYWPLIHNGSYYRLTDPQHNEGYHAWEFVSPDKQEALICVVTMHVCQNGPSMILKARGLKENGIYRLEDRELPGGALMEGGILLPVSREYDCCCYYLREITPE